jgi:thioredoxin-like negative regulator of GroEL
MQMLANVKGSDRVEGYAVCAKESLKRDDLAGARRLVEQAVESHQAGPDHRRWAIRDIAEALAHLGEIARAKALADAEPADARSVGYLQIARWQTVHEGPGAAYARAKELKLPLERAYAYAGIAKGLAKSQRFIENALPAY